MATAVIDVDANDLPGEISGLHRYRRALVLFRFRGRPVARAYIELDVREGSISRLDLIHAMGSEARYMCQERLVWDMLGWVEKPTPRLMPSSTVAICTRDRPDDLKRCLEGVLQLYPDGQEILVIDNCPSTDSSMEVVATFPGVRYVREPLPGLNHARNRALREARGEIVAYIDDDATPDPGWLRALLLNFDRPIVMCVTGLTMPLELEAKAQEQFESYSTFARGFRRQTFSSAWQNPLAAGNIGSGTNMSVRREILDLFGGFDNALDAGSPTQSGGDHEMFSRMMISGYRIVYEPAALNWHRHRRTFAELEKTIYGYGVGVYSALLRALLVDRELGVFRIAYLWFRHAQLRNLLRGLLRRRDAPSLRLVIAELRGCLVAPRAYWKSNRRLKTLGSSRNG